MALFSVAHPSEFRRPWCEQLLVIGVSQLAITCLLLTIGFVGEGRVWAGCDSLTQDGWYLRSHEMLYESIVTTNTLVARRDAQVLVHYEAGVFRFRLTSHPKPCLGPGCQGRPPLPESTFHLIRSYDPPTLRGDAEFDMVFSPAVPGERIASLNTWMESEETPPPTPPPRARIE